MRDEKRAPLKTPALEAKMAGVVNKEYYKKTESLDNAFVELCLAYHHGI